MRISDWSSYVCSSDLLTQVQLRKDNRLYINDGIYGSLSEMATVAIRLPARLIRLDAPVSETLGEFALNGPTCDSLDVLPGTFTLPVDVREGDWIEIDQVRSEEHTSELQSLMRISYAVFCLKKKKKARHPKTHQN